MSSLLSIMPQDLTTRIRANLEPARAFAERHKALFLLLALALFTAGVIWSAQALDFDAKTLRWGPAILVLLVLAPAAVIVGAWNLQLTGHVITRIVGFGDALRVTAYGRVAELLPMPGVLVARAAALLKTGAGMGETALVLGWSSMLTLALAAVFLAAALLASGQVAGWAVAALGGVFLGASAVWLWRKIGVVHLLQQLSVRLAGLSLGVARLYLCFLALDQAIDPIKAATFVIGSSFTSMIGIVPAGLGIAEGIGAGLALLVEVNPAAAFLALALNRLLGLVVNGCAALVLLQFPSQPK